MSEGEQRREHWIPDDKVGILCFFVFWGFGFWIFFFFSFMSSKLLGQM